MIGIALLSQPCSSRFGAAVYAGLAKQHLRSYRSGSSQRTFHSSSRLNEVKEAQPQTAATDNIELSAPATYISESDDPWFNLSYEDCRLLRNTPHNQPILFFYRNRPCVVIGRNQNPWQETTPRQLEEWGIPLVRRRSGGGTVFHDLGNTNFSILLPRLLFTRSHGAELVARAVRERLRIRQCTVNDRGDVIIRDEGKDFKVSGSAYKIIQHRAYHHGTMLISSSLENLGKALKSSSPNIQGKSVPSFRSPVTKLNAYLLPSRNSPLDHPDFVDAVMQEFAVVYGGGDKQMFVQAIKEDGQMQPVTESVRSSEAPKEMMDKVQKGVEELKSWEWTYGQTPEFTNDLEGELSFGKVSASMTARHALIQSLTFHYTPPLSANNQTRDNDMKIQQQLDALALSLVGKRYATLIGAEEDGGGCPAKISEEIVTWLRHSM